MEILSIVLTSVVSLLLLFLLCKLMGNKQISQLSMFDYIVGISIGSIAAELATELENPLYPALAMVLYGLAAFAISVLTSKSVALRKFMTGKPLLLMQEGKIYRENMKKARFDLSDFLTLCRINGYFDLSAIQTAILEENGTVSFLPKSGMRPLQPQDVQVYPPEETVRGNVILDGVILPRTLSALGYDENWLMKELSQRGVHGPKDVYLATLTKAGELQLYPMVLGNKEFSPFD
jgi:uncharacterized membrane protein YcaP (DUF421 family)